MGQVRLEPNNYGEATSAVECIQHQMQWLVDVTEILGQIEGTRELMVISAALYTLSLRIHDTPFMPPPPYYHST